MFVPWIEAMPVRVLIDHCGRPTPEAGLDAAGLSGAAAARSDEAGQRQVVGLLEIFASALPVRGLLAVRRAPLSRRSRSTAAYGLRIGRFLRATQRQDYGPLVELAELLFPNPAERRKLFCDTPRRLFGFDGV